jgi:hypothetical protein
MQTVEIARNQWRGVLDDFSRKYRGKLVSLDVLGPSLGAQPGVRDLPLIGIAAEPGAQGAISIAAARSADDHLTHTIQSPTHIWIERSDEGTDVALEVESADGLKTILRFKTILPSQAGNVG